jgi:hypothetical protein
MPVQSLGSLSAAAFVNNADDAREISSDAIGDEAIANRRVFQVIPARGMDQKLRVVFRMISVTVEIALQSRKQ